MRSQQQEGMNAVREPFFMRNIKIYFYAKVFIHCEYLKVCRIHATATIFITIVFKYLPDIFMWKKTHFIQDE
jgi:hypothetical protein